MEKLVLSGNIIKSQQHDHHLRRLTGSFSKILFNIKMLFRHFILIDKVTYFGKTPQFYIQQREMRYVIIGENNRAKGMDSFFVKHVEISGSLKLAGVWRLIMKMPDVCSFSAPILL